MPKYEIMTITDPKYKSEDTKAFFEKIFGKDLIKFKKLENNKLAYEINKSKIGTYFLVEVNSNGETITEFRRKVNIDKNF
jgi:small subunit ribosomal protein S6